MSGTALLIDQILRGIVLAAFSAAGLVALTHWLVREGKVAAFGTWAVGVRRLSDPVVKPIERMIIRQGRNPQEAPFWLLGLVVIGGIALIMGGRWITGILLTMAAAGHQGPRAWLLFVVELAFNLLLLALVVRVIGSWFGVGRYTKWMRPFYVVTDWLVEPIRRRLPPLGMVDFSPLVAYLVVLVLRAIVVGVLT